jgi:hypothetical protein
MRSRRAEADARGLDGRSGSVVWFVQSIAPIGSANPQTPAGLADLGSSTLLYVQYLPVRGGPSL